MFCSALQVLSGWLRVQTLMDEKKIDTNEKGENVEVEQEELFEVEQTAFFYTRTPAHY